MNAPRPNSSSRRFGSAREGFAPVRDRLVTTLFLAGVVHAIIIAGISFTAAEAGNAAPGLEVLLVSEDLPTAETNDDAAYLSQRTQLGSGTTTERTAARNPLAADPQLERAGRERGAAAATAPDGAEARRSEGAQSVLASAAPERDIARIGIELTAAEPEVAALAQPAVNSPLTPGRDAVAATELTGPARDELWISPDSRATPFAPYVDGWRRKIERLGTLNFPAAARDIAATQKIRNPVVEVAIDARGKLVKAQIQRSSGAAQLDAAALQILRLASPFEPFPVELARQVRMLRFAYEWRFECVGTLCAPQASPHTAQYER